MEIVNSIGEYTEKNHCRLCEGKNLFEVLNFGNVPLAGGFLSKVDIKDEKHYPLIVEFCYDCYLVQVKNIISVDILFREKYFFFSSSIMTLKDHFNEFANEIFDTYLKKKKNPSCLEIGCNDGVLLKPLSSLGIKTIGVDPATNVISKINSEKIIVYNHCFTESLAKQIKNNDGKVDIILSSYSFAHIDDMIDIMKGINHLLKRDGLLIVEIYYLGTIIDGMQYDNIYHEHMSYYSISTLTSFFKRFNMEIFDVKFFPNMRSGSTRFYVKNKGDKTRKISSNYFKMLRFEKLKGFNDIATLKKFANKVLQTKEELLSILKSIKEEGHSIVGYGASGRGTMISNYCGINNKYVDYVIDDAPQKHGFYTPGTHLPIKPWEYLIKSGMPEYILLLSWAFTNEIITKRKDYLENGGKFIIPLPEVRIISNENL